MLPSSFWLVTWKREKGNKKRFLEGLLQTYISCKILRREALSLLLFRVHFARAIPVKKVGRIDTLMAFC